MPGQREKTAFLVEKGVSEERMAEIRREAAALRETGCDVLVTVMNKNKKFQKDQLSQEGWTQYREFFAR